MQVHRDMDEFVGNYPQKQRILQLSLKKLESDKSTRR